MCLTSSAPGENQEIGGAENSTGEQIKQLLREKTAKEDVVHQQK